MSELQSLLWDSPSQFDLFEFILAIAVITCLSWSFHEPAGKRQLDHLLDEFPVKSNHAPLSDATGKAAEGDADGEQNGESKKAQLKNSDQEATQPRGVDLVGSEADFHWPCVNRMRSLPAPGPWWLRQPTSQPYSPFPSQLEHVTCKVFSCISFERPFYLLSTLIVMGVGRGTKESVAKPPLKLWIKRFSRLSEILLLGGAMADSESSVES